MLKRATRTHHIKKQFTQVTSVIDWQPYIEMYIEELCELGET